MLKTSQLKKDLKQWGWKARQVFLAVFVPNEKNCFLPQALRSQYLFWYGAGLLMIKIALVSLILVLPSTEIFSAITADRLISLINQARQVKNLSALTLNTSLNSVADLKVNDMLAKNYFDHTSPAGISPWYWFKQIGYNYLYAGENLAMGFTESDAVFQAWMNSPSHRDNILNPNYQEMGLAVKSGQIKDHSDTLAVLVFGKRQTSSPKKSVAPTTPAKTPIVKSTPTVSAKPSNVPSPTALKTTPLSSATSSNAPSRSPVALAEQTATFSSSPSIKPENNSMALAVKIAYAPRVLGAFTSKSDEIFKSLYLYFTLFLAIALLVNIFVKIRIQHWPTIIATTLIIILSTTLTFI